MILWWKEKGREVSAGDDDVGLRCKGCVRPKTPAPMMRIESKEWGAWVVGGEVAAMLRIKEVMDVRR